MQNIYFYNFQGLASFFLLKPEDVVHVIESNFLQQQKSSSTKTKKN